MNNRIKEILGYVFIILIVVAFRTFIATPIKVNGNSMFPTLEDGTFMILKKFDKDFERYDIVVVDDDGSKLIKRVIGMPKEDIEYKDNELYIDGKLYEDIYGKGYTNDFVDYCTDDEYFIMGDNREDSKDSRMIGCVKKEDIIGKTNYIIFPFSKWGSVE